MADFVIDTQTLRDAARIVTSISTEFSNASSSVETAESAAGHWILEQAIVDFAGGWDQHRKELLEQLEGLKAALTTAADAIEDTDSGLAAELEC